MKRFVYVFLVFFFLGINSLNAQDDLLNELEDSVVIDHTVTAAFKALQIATFQSTKMAAKKDFYFVVAHRFGSVSNGFSEFFGLDNATTKIGFIYGLSDGITLAASRHTFQKTYEFSGKYRIFQQKEEGFPFNVVGFNSLAINSALDKDDFPNIDFQDRLSYTSQLLISRKFSDKLSLQIMPIYVHKNLIDDNLENDNQFVLGAGGRFKLSNRISFNAEYAYNFNQPDFYSQPLTLGFDIETGGHVFQLLFSNSQPMTEANYITNAAGDWGAGDIYFGFNLYRVF